MRPFLRVTRRDEGRSAGGDHRHKGVSYPAGAFEALVRHALEHVSANADLAAAVMAHIEVDATAPDPITLARIERDRDAAMARYRRDRDPGALEATMRALDREETEAKATRADGPSAEEAVEYLRNLPSLWETTPSCPSRCSRPWAPSTTRPSSRPVIER